LASAARTIAIASAWFMAIGFSQSACLPAAKAASAMGAWVKLGVAMMTASTSSRVTISSNRVEVTFTPVCCRARSSVVESVSQSATTLASGHRAMPGR
jgi:hypothetical protein